MFKVHQSGTSVFKISLTIFT